MHLKSSIEDIESQLLLLQANVELLQFDKVSKRADEMTQLYPNQPEFYYYAGLGNNQLGNFKKAKEFLETGVDFIIDDTSLEINFYVQLGEAFNGLGDMKKKEQYFSKADALIKKQKR